MSSVVTGYNSTDVYRLNVLRGTMIVVNSAAAATDLLEQRGPKYSGRRDMPMVTELYGDHSRDVRHLQDRRRRGNEVDIVMKVLPGSASHVRSFPCKFTPRSKASAALIEELAHELK
ncbi:hypothetical protein B0H19DRAFT_1268966 [Mycena capillaripes]|nr:hypothetical protein B0H19DRAFT_1268966 [Mycena capillaripes]